ncbi:threonylcarbamoyl-AMP synthase [Spirochaetia bacterium]|nr:threonylcarbamoyl-AMP synthase [Spirochaetia bacterium]
MLLKPIDDETIAAAAAILRSGGLVAFPTETVYGLGADGFNVSALAKVFAAKNRPRFDPLILHIADLASLSRVANLDALGITAQKQVALLTTQRWPGPLTLILPKQPEVPDLATSGLPTAAIRFPDHPAAQKLIRRSTGVIAAPSANPFGYLSPTRAEHVRDQLGDRVDMILDGGPARVGVESTVLDMTLARPRILRPGGMPRERIEALIGAVDVIDSAAGNDTVPTVSPGQLKSHYAPRTPLKVYSREALIALPREGEAAYLFFDGSSRDAWLQAGGRINGCICGPKVRVLSETGDLTEAAANLFETLHDMDTVGASCIRAERVRNEGLGPAINDRLFKAAAANQIF